MKNAKAIVPLLLAVFIDLVGFSVALPVLPSLFLDPASGVLPADTPHATRTILLGALLALFPLIQMFSAPVLGALADRHGRRPVLMLSFLGTLAGHLLFGVGIVTQQLWLLVLGRAIDGATGGNISVAQAAIADLSDARSRGKNFALIGMAFGFGFIIGPYLGGKLSDPSVLSWFSFATPFWFAAALTAANLALLALWLPETLAARRNTPVTALTGMRNLRLAFSLPRVRLLFVVQLLLVLGFTSYTSYFQVYLIERFHLTQSQIGDVFGFVGLCIALSQGFVARPLSARFTSAQLLRVAPVGLAAALMLVLVPTRAIGMFFVFPFLATFQGIASTSIMSLISEQADASSQGEMLGMNQSVTSFGQFLPGLFGGAAAAAHAGAPTVIAAGLTVVAWAIFVAGFRRAPQKPFHEI